jgi:hypothetical protein
MSVRELINDLIKCNRNLETEQQLIYELLQEVNKVENEIQSNFQGSNSLNKLLIPLQNTKESLRKSSNEMKQSQEKIRRLQEKLRR